MTLSEKEVVKKISVREALRDAMREEMQRNKNVFLMGEEVAQYQGAYKVSGDLFKEFNIPGEVDRVIDTPITEHGFAGIGVGAAMAGLNPIIEFMTFNFAMQAIDQIINSAAKTSYMSGGQIKCPVVFRGPNGSASRVGAQHSQDYTSWYANIPGLKVIAPYYANDCKGLLKSAIRDGGPVIFLENELTYGHEHEVPDDMISKGSDYLIPIGIGRVIHEGTDITIVCYSKMVALVMQALPTIKEKDISPEVIDLRTIRPLDKDIIINSVKKTNRILIVDEGWGFASVASEIIALVNSDAFDDLDHEPMRINAKDVPLPYAANLEKLALPSVDEIVLKVSEIFNYK